MTVQRAKEVLNNIWDFADAQDEEKGDIVDDAIIEAIGSMEEVEQYRAFKEIFESQFSSEALKLLNDKEEFTRWLERGKWNARKCDELNKELEQYRALGTVEELKEAREKQVAKKPNMKTVVFCDEAEDAYVCSACEGESLLFEGQPYCENCGQALKWGEEDEQG